MSGWWFKVTEQISLAWELTEGQSRCMGQKADLSGSVQIFGLKLQPVTWAGVSGLNNYWRNATVTNNSRNRSFILQGSFSRSFVSENLKWAIFSIIMEIWYCMPFLEDWLEGGKSHFKISLPWASVLMASNNKNTFEIKFNCLGHD